MKKTLLSLVPANNRILYRLCKRYVDLYNSENDGDIETNGELHFMRSVLGRCRTVFDVGANVGDWTSLALGINPLLAIHCFEPSKATFERLRSRKFPSAVVCNNCGMSSAPGEKTLFVFEDEAGINSLYQRRGLESFGLSTQQRKETIVLDTVDDYCQRQGIKTIDFLKVDVEGHELEVFKGASGMLAERRIHMIQFEYGGANIDARVWLKDLFEFVGTLGYDFYKVYPKELRRVERYDQRLENFQYQNWVAMANPAPQP